MRSKGRKGETGGAGGEEEKGSDVGTEEGHRRTRTERTRFETGSRAIKEFLVCNTGKQFKASAFCSHTLFDEWAAHTFMQF